nr:MAG TPA: hypothetical protein [Caudoviricetes sp.]
MFVHFLWFVQSCTKAKMPLILHWQKNKALRAC